MGRAPRAWIIALLVAGCGSAAPSAPPPSPSVASPTVVPPAPTVSAAQRFRSTTFAVPFSFDAQLAESTWHQHLEQENWTYFGFRPASNEDEEGISIHALDSIGPSPACARSNDPWPTWKPWAPNGNRSQTFIDWLLAELPVAPKTPSPVSLGSLAGLQVDVGPDQMASCEILWVTRTQADNALLLAGRAQQRLLVFDSHQRTLVIVLITLDPARFPVLAHDADALFATWTFD